MQSTKSWVVGYFQKHETVKFSLLLRFVRDMDSLTGNTIIDMCSCTQRLSLNCYRRSKSNKRFKHYN